MQQSVISGVQSRERQTDRQTDTVTQLLQRQTRRTEAEYADDKMLDKGQYSS